MNWFPLNYEASRRRFLERIKELSQLYSIDKFQFRVESQKEKDLFVDAFYLPAKLSPERLIVLTSGVHGSESYAGSALLDYFICKNLPTADTNTTAYLLVHALNPFGFKLHKRTTESGVNLNRNFSASLEMFEQKNPQSLEFSEQFLERTPVSGPNSKWLQSMSDSHDQPVFKGRSLNQVIQMTAPGQFYGPEHLEYGGKKPEPQSEWLMRLLESKLHQFKEVFAFDIHTGLGDRGQLHILGNDPGDRIDSEFFNLMVRNPQDRFVYTPSSAEGFYATFGSLQDVYYQLTSSQQRICSLTLEFGTLGHSVSQQVEGMNSFILDHQVFHYGATSPELSSLVQERNFLRSYPQDVEWKQAVVEKGSFFIERALRPKT